MWKWLIILFVFALSVWIFIAYAYSRSLATAGILMGQQILPDELTNFLANGEILSKNHTFPYTNSFQIDGANYTCVLRYEDAKFAGAGSLAITTNKTFLLIARNGTAKIIPKGYRPPFFPPKM